MYRMAVTLLCNRTPSDYLSLLPPGWILTDVMCRWSQWINRNRFNGSAKYYDNLCIIQENMFVFLLVTFYWKGIEMTFMRTCTRSFQFHLFYNNIHWSNDTLSRCFTNLIYNLPLLLFLVANFSSILIVFKIRLKDIVLFKCIKYMYSSMWMPFRKDHVHIG